VITAPSLRPDLEVDRARLDETVARPRPRLLVLNPLVLLHRIDENVGGDVVPLLAFANCSIATSSPSRWSIMLGRGQAPSAPQALRGSSEFHA